MSGIFARWAVREQKLLQYHEDMMDQVYLEHFTFPTNIPNYHMTPQEISEQSALDHTGQAAVRAELQRYQNELRSSGYNQKARELDAVINQFNGRRSITFDRANELLGMTRRRDTYDLLARLPEEQYKTWMNNARQSGRFGREAYEIANGLDHQKITMFHRDGYVNGMPRSSRSGSSPRNTPGVASSVRTMSEASEGADSSSATGCVFIVFALMAIMIMVALIL